MKTCNSCGAQIIWGKTIFGKKVPLDPKPKKVFVLMNAAESVYQQYTGFETHFSSCPNAKEFRK